jgi:hypothetical protein
VGSNLRFFDRAKALMLKRLLTVVFDVPQMTIVIDQKRRLDIRDRRCDPHQKSPASRCGTAAETAALRCRVPFCSQAVFSRSFSPSPPLLPISSAARLYG